LTEHCEQSILIYSSLFFSKDYNEYAIKTAGQLN